MDWLLIYFVVVGVLDIKEQLKEGGVQVIGCEYKVYLDGYNFLLYFIGEVDKGLCQEIFYFFDDGDLIVLCYVDWKMIFMEQKEYIMFCVWIELFMLLCVLFIFNLWWDLYEWFYWIFNIYYDWLIDWVYLLVLVQQYVGVFL